MTHAVSRPRYLKGSWQLFSVLQELQNDSGGDVSSDGGSPTARDSGDGAVTPVSQARTQRASGTGSLTKRLSGRFSQEAFAAKEQELSFLQQRCVQFEVRFLSHQGASAAASICSSGWNSSRCHESWQHAPAPTCVLYCEAELSRVPWVPCVPWVRHPASATLERPTTF
jgi:hypothetical protein